MQLTCCLVAEPNCDRLCVTVNNICGLQNSVLFFYKNPHVNLLVVASMWYRSHGSLSCSQGHLDSPHHTWTAGWGLTSPHLHCPPLSPCAGPESSGFCLYWSPSLEFSLCLFHTVTHMHTRTHTYNPVCPDTLWHYLCTKGEACQYLQEITISQRDGTCYLILHYDRNLLCQGAGLCSNKSPILRLPIKVPNCSLMKPWTL